MSVYTRYSRVKTASKLGHYDRRKGLKWLLAGVVTQTAGPRFAAIARIRRAFGSYPEPLTGEGGIVVSLTSFPPRMKHLWMTVDSLMRQEVRPAEILLHLYEGDFPGGDGIPASLKPYLGRGLKIVWAPEDLRPHLKYFYSIPAEADGLRRCVVTVDDDLFYLPDTLSRLQALHRLHPDDVCANIVKKAVGPHYADWEWPLHPTSGDKDAVALGFGGVLYPPSFYDRCRERLFDIGSIRGLCLGQDDLWLKTVENLCGVSVSSGEYFPLPPDVPGSQKISLSALNVKMAGNDAVWAALSDKFKPEAQEQA